MHNECVSPTGANRECRGHVGALAELGYSEKATPPQNVIGRNSP